MARCVLGVALCLASCGGGPQVAGPTESKLDNRAPVTATNPHDSRQLLTRAVFDAINANDANALVALADPPTVYTKAMVCESTEREPQKVEQELRNRLRKTLAGKKGERYEVVEVTRLVRNDDRSFEKGKRKEGCTARSDVDFHQATVTVKNGTRDVKLTLGLFEIEDRWYLAEPPRLNDPNQVALDMMATFADNMCTCKDKACVERVNDEYTRAMAELAKEMGGEHVRTKIDQEVVKRMTELSTRYGECMARAMGQP